MISIADRTVFSIQLLDETKKGQIIEWKNAVPR